MPDPLELRLIAQRYAAAWCSQDPGSVAAHYAPEGSLAINGGTPAVGRNAIAEVALSFMTALPDIAVLFDDLVVRDDRTEFHWTFTGTNTGPGGTGNAVRVSGYEAWTLAPDGLIADSRGHYDQNEYDRQLAHGVDGTA